MDATITASLCQEKVSNAFLTGLFFPFGFFLFGLVIYWLVSPSKTSIVITGTGKAYLGSESDESEVESEVESEDESVTTKTTDCLKVQLLNKSTEEFYQERMNHETDSGFDLYVPEETTIQPHQTVLVGMGVYCEPGYTQSTVKKGYYLYPRSSIYKTGLFLANSVGVIDFEYRGEIKAALHNLTDKPVTIKHGQRIVQVCMSDLSPFEVEFVDSLTETARGEGGFGSTDKKETNVDSTNSPFTDAMDQATKNVTPIIEEDETLEEPVEVTTPYVVNDVADQADQSDDESDNEDAVNDQPLDANDSDGDSMAVQVDTTQL